MSSIRIGTSGWTYKDWKNKFYPPNCPQNHWLEYYSTVCDTVELNATFYRFFSEENYLRWYGRVPRGFKYVVKVPGYITHRKLLRDAETQMTTFCQSAKLLKEKLALILLQLPARLPYDLERLEEKLVLFGQQARKLVVEFRHERWLTEETLKLLKKYKAIFCNVDSPTRYNETILTAKTSYIRLHGRKTLYDYCYSSKELEGIANQAYTLQQKGAEKIYIFFNNDVDANAIKNALTLKKMMGL